MELRIKSIYKEDYQEGYNEVRCKIDGHLDEIEFLIDCSYDKEGDEFYVFDGYYEIYDEEEGDWEEIHNLDIDITNDLDEFLNNFKRIILKGLEEEGNIIFEGEGVVI